MVDIIEPTTVRLKLRQWRDEDKADFARMNADTEVMQYFPNELSTEQSNTLADKIQNLIEQQGWGLWALEETSVNKFIGFTGLHKPRAEIPCAPCIEIGWRLAKSYWGQGYATEAASASLEVAFTRIQCQAVFSFSAIPNTRSQTLMQRLGMQDTGENFHHPDVPASHILSEHVLYKITREHWNQHVK